MGAIDKISPIGANKGNNSTLLSRFESATLVNSECALQIRFAKHSWLRLLPVLLVWGALPAGGLNPGYIATSPKAAPFTRFWSIDLGATGLR